MGQRQYQAFISYSHCDKDVAAWLHRALETYDIPAKLVGTRTDAGIVPKRLTPIFKDREELPATDNLGAAVDAALQVSNALIVLCSPDAATSTWVNREIERFRELHGGGRIFAALAQGEPCESFPPALSTGQSDEPIAADLRPEGDGRKLAKLKLVAGLSGLDLDQLVGRDAQRKQQRLAVVAAASLVGMIGTSSLAVYAVQQRDDARTQRAEANDLVQYMLTDLRSKLEPVGKLDVLDGVGRKALAYYARQKLDDLSADELGQRAKAMLLVAEVGDLRGNAASAEQGFQEAARSTAVLLARDPDNWQRNYDHAQSEFWLAYAATNRGDNKAALPHFIAYRNLGQRLTEIDPNRLESKVELASADVNLGVALIGERKVEDARQLFNHAASTFMAISPRTRDVALNAANSVGHEATALTILGQDRESVALRHRQLQILEAPPLDASDREVQESKAIIASQLGESALATGDDADWRQWNGKSLAMWRQLLSLDPSNKFWRGQRNFAQMNEAISKSRLDRTSASRELAAVIADQLALLKARQDAVHAGHLLRMAAYQQVLTGTWGAWQQALVRDGWATRDNIDVGQRSALAMAIIAQGDALHRNDTALARQQWGAAKRLIGDGPRSTLDRINLARIDVRLGEQPRRGDVALARTAYAGIFAKEFGE
nr:toll/interleukin-1 receptor domain-containing protein [uncultured Sphingomonas sp.]